MHLWNFVKVAITFFYQVFYDQLMLGIFFCSRSDPIEVEQEWTILSRQMFPGLIPYLHIMLGLFHFHLQLRPTSLPSHIHHHSVLCTNTRKDYHRL
jgi:hypothetical protein